MSDESKILLNTAKQEYEMSQDRVTVPTAAVLMLVFAGLVIIGGLIGITRLLLLSWHMIIGGL